MISDRSISVANRFTLFDKLLTNIAKVCFLGYLIQIFPNE